MAADFDWDEVATGAVVEAEDVNQGKNVTDKLNSKELDRENILTDHTYFSVTKRFYFQAAFPADWDDRFIVLPDIDAKYIGCGWCSNAYANTNLKVTIMGVADAMDANLADAYSYLPGTPTALNGHAVRVTWRDLTGAKFGADKYLEAEVYFAAPIVKEPGT
ncbi:MAG: hypothetical protein WC789_10660 [Lentisphaeria bacterium]